MIDQIFYQLFQILMDIDNDEEAEQLDVTKANDALLVDEGEPCNSYNFPGKEWNQLLHYLQLTLSLSRIKIMVTKNLTLYLCSVWQAWGVYPVLP